LTNPHKTIDSIPLSLQLYPRPIRKQLRKLWQPLLSVTFLCPGSRSNTWACNSPCQLQRNERLVEQRNLQ